jgi:glycosyltransferase involved in cell wall biosynthesis
MFTDLVQLATFFDLILGLGWVALLLYDARELSYYGEHSLQVASSSNEQLVSVVIPVRNEEGQIEKCLDSIINQGHRNLEIIVVDDESTDRTGEIVSKYQALDPRIRFVRGDSLPNGWVGKNWACDQGYRASKGAWLVFIDSDSVLAEDTLGSALSYCSGHGLLALSIFPEVELRGFWAKAVWPSTSAMIRILYPLRSVNNPKGRSALAFGAFVLIGRTSYELIGGHTAVKGDLVEDKEIGKNLKSRGIPYRVLMGGGMLRAGLATGLGGIWNSIRRIVSNPVRKNKIVGVGFATALFAMYVYPILILLALSSTGYMQGVRGLVSLLSVLAPAAIVTYDVWNTPRPSYYFCLLAPIGGVMVMIAVLRELVGGSRVEWRGRTYMLPSHEAK